MFNFLHCWIEGKGEAVDYCLCCSCSYNTRKSTSWNSNRISGDGEPAKEVSVAVTTMPII